MAKVSSKVETMKSAETVELANKCHHANQIVNRANENMVTQKEALLDHIGPVFEENLLGQEEGLIATKNFKVLCGEVGDDGVVLDNGILVQVQMKLGTDEVDPVVAAGLRSALGDSFVKLFDTKEVFEEIVDLEALLKSINALLVEKAAKIGTKGDFTLKIPTVTEEHKGVKSRTAIFPKSGLLDKIANIPNSDADKARPQLEEFIQAMVKPAVVIANKPAEK